MTKDQHNIRDFNRARWQVRNELRWWKGFAGLLGAVHDLVGMIRYGE